MPKRLNTSPSSRAQSFQRTRRHHRNEAAEDYTELVADLIDAHGEARTCTIAKELGISHVTALRTIQRLQDQGLMHTKPHQPVTLTAKGQRLARAARARHQLLVDLFLHLGVPRSVAEIDAEGAEHHISPLTLRQIASFLKKV